MDRADLERVRRLVIKQMAFEPDDRVVVVAMSGGVDSSVAAALLKEAGYRVVGMTLQLYKAEGEEVAKKKACCAGVDIVDATKVADTLGIDHYVLDYKGRFEEAVIVPFAKSYTEGKTPIPCILCNQTVKFSDLLMRSEQLKARALVTGHYIRRLSHNGIPSLHRACDAAKDQSYFLFATTLEQLQFLRFPLGQFATKVEVRQLAVHFSLPVAEKPDSQDICFIPNGNYADLVKVFYPESVKKGDIVNQQGQVIGTHDGIVNYTVGQRRRLGVGGLKTPLYVVEIDTLRNTIVVGEKEALRCEELQIYEVNWLGEEPKKERLLHAKVRANAKAVLARFTPQDNGRGKVIFQEEEFAASPGQACVFYDDSRLMGGGWIGRRPLGRRPLGQRPLGRRPLGRRPLGRRPLGRRPLGRRPLGRRPLRPLGQRPLGRRPLGRRPLSPKTFHYHTRPESLKED